LIIELREIPASGVIDGIGYISFDTDAANLFFRSVSSRRQCRSRG